MEAPQPPSNSPEGEGLKIVLQTIEQSKGISSRSVVKPQVRSLHRVGIGVGECYKVWKKMLKESPRMSFSGTEESTIFDRM